MKKYIDLLDSANLFGWKIVEIKKKTTELYYILDKLETNRSTNETLYNVTVYVLNNKKVGASTFDIYPYMDNEEIKRKINDNKLNALNALNDYYELPKYEHLHHRDLTTNLNESPLKVLEKVKKAICSVKSEAYLSATEFFLSEIDERLINSNGVDVKQKSFRLNIELIPTYKDVEIYKMLELEKYDLLAIKKEIKELLNLAIKRYEAKELEKKENLAIILENDEVAQLLSFFSDDLTYGAKYQHININEINDSVQGECIGDKLNIKMVPYYSGCIGSRDFDGDGVILKEISLIEDGIAKNMYGSYRFGYYLKQNPTGVLPVMVVGEGSKELKDFKKYKYVKCSRFSNMQLDPNTGFFGGEVRVGFYFAGRKEIPVTGFSLSGNINELKKELYLSKETVDLPNYHGPKYILIKGMKIA
jgi:predicted Zn-dependent protease